MGDAGRRSSPEQEHGVRDTVHALVESELARDLGPLDLPCSLLLGVWLQLRLRCRYGALR